MRLNRFICLHKTKYFEGSSQDKALLAAEDAFLNNLSMMKFETCQRILYFGYSEELNIKDRFCSLEYSDGWRAYSYILRVICGLESKVFGETEVLGQFKNQWLALCKTDHLASKELVSIVNKLLSDAKLIRTKFLAGFGGQSYASLSRQLIESFSIQLEAQGNKSKQVIGVVGYGKLAKSIAGIYREAELCFWNRSEIEPGVLSGIEGLQNLLQQPLRALVVTIPAGSDYEVLIAAQMIAKNIPVIHLAGHDADLGHWESAWSKRYLKSLNHIYELASTNQPKRKEAFILARKECDAHSKMRFLGQTLHTTHCWEDLAFFATSY